MQYVSASEVKNNLSAIIEAAKREPITVQKNGRNSVVIIATEDYDRITNINKTIFRDSIAAIQNEAINNGLTELKLGDILDNE
jgi:prevent-host-death family protein